MRHTQWRYPTVSETRKQKHLSDAYDASRHTVAGYYNRPRCLTPSRRAPSTTATQLTSKSILTKAL